MNNNILVYFEHSESFICCITYQNDCSSIAIAHIWEHLVLETCLANKKTLKDYIKEMGGTIHAETNNFLTSFFIKIPKIDYDSIDTIQLIMSIDHIIRIPTIEKNVEKVIKEVYLEEQLRQDAPMKFALNQLREIVYDNHLSRQDSLDAIMQKLYIFAEKMSSQVFYISLSANTLEPDVYDIFDRVIFENETVSTDVAHLNIISNINTMSKFLEYSTSLHYLAIMIIPQRLCKILLPFINYIVFGYFSPFIRRLHQNRLIYQYISGINYSNPVGIEFVTAVLPHDHQYVMNQWKIFINDTRQYLSVAFMKKMVDSFLQSVNLEWQSHDKKMKWLSESYAYYKKRITPKTLSYVLNQPNIINTLPYSLQKSAYYILSIGTNHEKSQSGFLES